VVLWVVCCIALPAPPSYLVRIFETNPKRHSHLHGAVAESSPSAMQTRTTWNYETNRARTMKPIALLEPVEVVVVAVSASSSTIDLEARCQARNADSERDRERKKAKQSRSIVSLTIRTNRKQQQDTDPPLPPSSSSCFKTTTMKSVQQSNNFHASSNNKTTGSKKERSDVHFFFFALKKMVLGARVSTNTYQALLDDDASSIGNISIATTRSSTSNMSHDENFDHIAELRAIYAVRRNDDNNIRSPSDCERVAEVETTARHRASLSRTFEQNECDFFYDEDGILNTAADFQHADPYWAWYQPQREQTMAQASCDDFDDDSDDDSSSCESEDSTIETSYSYGSYSNLSNSTDFSSLSG
jgi:hypothetical protein